MENIMRVITTSVLVTAALLGLCVGEARAQTFVVAKVPFEFTLRGQRFPAGTYEIREAGIADGVISVQGTSNGKMSFTFAQRVFGTDPAGTRPALVFNRYENGYRLSAIWESATEGLTLPPAEHGSETSRADIAPDGSGELTYVVAASLK
jgi:hypothetical protein